ncbi:MAG: hypothetical protein LRY24_01925 [Erysipelotrichaceae bacterium]|nr:hypothetical protein [Erysipelotrichaceae bacterium]MCD8574498.1 hypothetical protein [Erysipelotrichaceae bacterium]
MKKRNLLQNKQGIAIMSVLLMFTVMSIFVGGITMVSVSNVNQSDVNAQSLSAYYAAEGGINRILEEYRSLYENSSLTATQVQNGIGNIRSKYHMQSMELKDNNGKPVNVEFWFDVHDHDMINHRLVATIVSQGQVEDVVRTLETMVEFTYGTGTTTMNMQLRHAVFVRNSITTSNNATITTVNPSDATLVPRIATLATQTGRITLNNITFPRGEIELINPSANCNNNTVVASASRWDGSRCRINDTVLVTEDRPVEDPEIRINFPVINFTPIRTQVAGIMASSSNYTTVNSETALLSGTTFRNGNFFISELNFNDLSSLRNLSINEGDHIFIITNRLVLGNVNISGNGKITIYVNPGSNTFSHSTNNVVFGRVDQEEKLEIYVDTISGVANNAYHVTLANNTFTKAYLMFDNARVSFGNNSRLSGALYTGAVNGSGSNYAIRLGNNAYISSGGGRALLVAPNGRVQLNNNSSLVGAVIANDVNMGGGNTTITFDPDFPQNIPFEITTPIEVTNPGGLSKQLTIRGTREK